MVGKTVSISDRSSVVRRGRVSADRHCGNPGACAGGDIICADDARGAVEYSARGVRERPSTYFRRAIVAAVAAPQPGDPPRAVGIVGACRARVRGLLARVPAVDVAFVADECVMLPRDHRHYLILIWLLLCVMLFMLSIYSSSK